MPRLSLLGGIGAVGSAMAHFFHPSEHIRAKWPNDDKRRLTGVLVVGGGMRCVARKEQMCYLVRIDNIGEDVVLHIVKKNFKITVAPTEPFPSEALIHAPAAPGDAVNPDRSSNRNTTINIEGGLSRAGTREEIEQLRQQGITVDDDNEPAPENAQALEVGEHTGTWEKPQYCCRRANTYSDQAGRFVHHRWDKIAEMDELQLFRMCFPEKWIVDSVIPETNKNLGTPVDLHEFYVWLGCIFFMSCYLGVEDRDLWWSTKPVNMFEGAPFRLNEFMTKTRFREIMEAIRYTSKEAPLLFVDRFHEIREMIDAFNNHYASEYRPSWLSCLDESMNSWLNKFCPGFMSLPRKPHPFGNEYHSIADGDDGKPIMWRVRIVEGKDRPRKPDETFAFPTKWEKKVYSNTVELVLDMTEPIHHTGKIVTGDSGFCVAVGVMALHQVGVHGQFLIKKRRYWPKHVPGDYIDSHMMEKPLGETELYVQELGGVRFFVHCTRDADYVTKIMSTHGVLQEIQDHPTWRFVEGEWKTFKYAEPFSRHNRAKHWVDDVNNRRHDPIGLEEVWQTKWWPNRQFTFLLSVAEVNCVQARARGRKEAAEPTLTFRRNLAMRMLRNKIQSNGVAAASPPRIRRQSSTIHVLKKRKVQEGKWNFTTRTFKKTKTEYVRHPCSECKKGVRTYCACSPGAPLCSVCFGLHLQEHGN